MTTNGSFTAALAAHIEDAKSGSADVAHFANSLDALVKGSLEEVEALHAALNRLPKAWVAYARVGDEHSPEEETEEERLLNLLSWAARRLPHSVREYLAEQEPRVVIAD